MARMMHGLCMMHGAHGAGPIRHSALMSQREGMRVLVYQTIVIRLMNVIIVIIVIIGWLVGWLVEWGWWGGSEVPNSLYIYIYIYINSRSTAPAAVTGIIV